MKLKKKSIRNLKMIDSGKNWNVMKGCDKYSDGCLNFYAESSVNMLKGSDDENYIKRMGSI